MREDEAVHSTATRWDQAEDPYNKYAEMPVEYKYCFSRTRASVAAAAAIAIPTRGRSQYASGSRRRSQRVSRRRDSTVRSRSPPARSATRTTASRVSERSEYVQPRCRARLTTAAAPMAGWQQNEPGETNAVSSLGTRYLVAKAIPATLKLKALSRALKKSDDGQAMLSAHTLGHALVGSAMDELLCIDHPSIPTEDVAATISSSGHMPACNALISDTDKIIDPFNKKPIDLSALAGSDLAKEMASGLAALGDGKL